MGKSASRASWQSLLSFALGVGASLEVAFGPAGLSSGDLASMGFASLCASQLWGRAHPELFNRRLPEIYALRSSGQWWMSGAEIGLTLIGLTLFVLSMVWGLRDLAGD